MVLLVVPVVVQVGGEALASEGVVCVLVWDVGVAWLLVVPLVYVVWEPVVLLCELPRLQYYNLVDLTYLIIFSLTLLQLVLKFKLETLQNNISNRVCKVTFSEMIQKTLLLQHFSNKIHTSKHINIHVHDKQLTAICI